MKAGIFGALLIYFSLLLGLSFWFSRKRKTVEDFFLASRNLSSFLVFFTVTASWIGATSMLVTMDEARRVGISSIWVMAAPAVVTILVFAFLLSGPIRKLPIVTLSDLVEARYGRVVRHMASFLIVWYMVLLAASQMVALGRFLGPFLGTSYLVSLAVGTAVVLIYASAGGFLSVVITDGLQFSLLMAGIFGLLLWAVKKGPEEILWAAGSNIFSREGIFLDFHRNILIFLSFTLAWIISPIIWQRIQSSRTAKTAKKGLLMSGLALTSIYAALIAIGIMAPGNASVEAPLLSFLITDMAGSFLGLLLFIAVLAAIMSTMDTAVNTGAMSMAHDILGQLRPGWNKGKGMIVLSRASTVLVGLAAFLVATRFQSILTTLGLASEIMAEGLFIPGTAMIFLKGEYPRAGILSLAAGGGFSLLSFLNQAGLMTGLPVWPYSLPYGLGLGGLGFAIGMVLDKRVSDKMNKMPS